MHHTIEHNQTVLEALEEFYPDSSKANLRSWLKQGRVSLDDRIVKKGNELVAAGQKLTVASKKQILGEGIRILFQDRHLVVIDKPAGVLSVSTHFDDTNTAHAWLKDRFRPTKVHVVHRLDQGTSGVMLFALSDEARVGLKKIFHDHDIQRTYIGIVEGHLTPPQGVWESYLVEDGNYVIHSTRDSSRGQRAITHYRVLDAFSRYCRVEFTLETGRKNQIRVHCQDAGCPIAGDTKYGAETDPINRLCLHASTLALRHPITGKTITFESPEPSSFEKFLKQGS